MVKQNSNIEKVLLDNTSLITTNTVQLPDGSERISKLCAVFQPLEISLSVFLMPDQIGMWREYPIIPEQFMQFGKTFVLQRYATCLIKCYQNKSCSWSEITFRPLSEK